jgi:hypothetical protein
MSLSVQTAVQEKKSQSKRSRGTVDHPRRLYKRYPEAHTILQYYQALEVDLLNLEDKYSAAEDKLKTLELILEDSAEAKLQKIRDVEKQISDLTEKLQDLHADSR